MKTLLIGHRGVGKTSLLQRMQIYLSLKGERISVFDLDREIEHSTGASLKETFDLIGEKNFREMELKMFHLLKKRDHFIISVGAGFSLEQADIDPETEIIWVRRRSDSLGRIFLDRPRLNSAVSPLMEFKERYEAREALYDRWAHWIYDLPEGLCAPSPVERALLLNEVSHMAGGMTITPRQHQQFSTFKRRQWRWDFDFFELRDDLLSDAAIEAFLAILPKPQVLLSFRQSGLSEKFLAALEDGYTVDWALELGPPRVKAKVLSLHERAKFGSLRDSIRHLHQSANSHQHLKLAVEIRNYAELEEGVRWVAEDASHRSFLPRSPEGRWNWTRLWLKDRQWLNFLREGHGTTLDQPSYFEWLSSAARPDSFAAVLGHPVEFSHSPVEQGSFFVAGDIPFYAIDIQEQEWVAAFPLLEKMGLDFAAVTSPLKKLAAAVAYRPSSLVKELNSANSMVRINEDWCAENTDVVGLRELLSTVGELGPVVIWGGGGTLSTIKKILPKAQAYSARTGSPRPGESETQPQTLIWAAGPAAEPPTSLSWAPQQVVDLNYREDSRAKEYCQRIGAKYISGLMMFKTQAQAQREFWEKLM